MLLPVLLGLESERSGHHVFFTERFGKVCFSYNFSFVSFNLAAMLFPVYLVSRVNSGHHAASGLFGLECEFWPRHVDIVIFVMERKLPFLI